MGNNDNHNLEDCPHNPTFEHFEKTLKRLEDHGERTAVAMEKLAENSAIVASQGEIIKTLSHDLRELFGRVRMIENGKADQSDYKAIDIRVRTIELSHAEENGEDKVIEKKTKFWENVKVQLADKLILFIIFVLVVADKFNIFIICSKLWEEVFNK